MDFDQNVNNKARRRHSTGFSRSPATFTSQTPSTETEMEVSEAIPRMQTQSKLPSYRAVDALLAPLSLPLGLPTLPSSSGSLLSPVSPLDSNPNPNPNHDQRGPRTITSNSSTSRNDTNNNINNNNTNLNLNLTAILTPQPHPLPLPPKRHTRHQSASFSRLPTNRDSNTKLTVDTLTLTPKHSSSASVPTIPHTLTSPTTNPIVNIKLNSAQTRVFEGSDLPTSSRRGHPATTPALGRNNKKSYGPPPSMMTRGFYDGQAHETDSTTNWVAQQTSMSLTQETEQPPSDPSPTGDIPAARPLIKPIRNFRNSSSRKSLEMSSRRRSRDPDETMKALDGYEENNSPRNSTSNHHHQKQQQQQQQQTEQDELTASDESDLFLRAAREEEKMAARQSTHSNSNSPSRADGRFSQTGQRASLPPPSVIFNPTISRRRGSLHESSNGPRLMDEQESIAQALTYRPTAKDRPTPPEDMNRNRYFTNNSRSNPTTPRTFNSRERSPESPASYGPRKNIQDTTLPGRTSYRQSNLSYTTPRTYNSSPLVSRSTEMHEVSETPRAAEGTESSVSTTAPSTVWDELEDLKSRIHRLELTGKLPATSGAAMSRASHDRPPTATTTVTTISSSPKRGRENSVSQDEPVNGEVQQTETHPLLHAALAKSKHILSPEIFSYLEAATSDALAIASMMGVSGQPGPISSSQSTIGGPATVSDRQVRRKADSMCRSLTELCLALSEAQAASATPVPAVFKSVTTGPVSQDKDEVLPSIETPMKQRQLGTTDNARAKSTPRALSRLEERRSTLLATSTLPSPRYTPSEVGNTPTSGRRTSMFLRTRRAGTEEPEGDDEPRFRAPSRANTEIGRRVASQREYTSQQPLPERPTAVQSSLPVRRHYTSTSLTNTIPPPMPPISSLGGRRFLERATPERDTSSLMGRLNEDREQRKPSVSYLGRTGSLTRKSRQSTPVDSPSAGQAVNYQ